jgi:predicted O-linked N-acetylglucosamine transferase (SPINDLY family)
MTTASRRLFEQAIEAHRRGAIEDAKSLYDQALRADPANVAACANLAIIAAQEGDFVRAEALFRENIRLQPNGAVGHHHLGSVLEQQGRWAEAVVAHSEAIRLDSKYAQAHLGLGNALKAQHRLDDALQSYAAALNLKPAYAAAHNNIGVVLQMQGKPDGAASAYRRAVEAVPAFAEAVFNLGVVLHEMHDFDGAEDAYRRAIALDPGVAVAYNNLGTVLKDLGRLDDALATFEQAIALQPNYPDAIYNRAAVLQQQGKLADALAGYGQALTLRPDYLDAANNAGIVLQELGRLADAIELYRRFVRAEPDNAGLYNNLGTALLADGQADEAMSAFHQALACRPDFPEAAYNLGNAWREMGRLSEALAAWQSALQLRADYPEAFSQLVHHRALACQWDSREADQDKILAMVRSGIRVPPFYLFATPATSADQWLAARQWAASIEPQQELRFDHRRRVQHGRIRLGYLSADFHQHATSQLMAGLFERHNRDRFEIVAYSYGLDDGSPMRARLIRAFDQFVDVGKLSHRETADRIHHDEIDILIDLKGYTQGSRPMIPAYRPAPVQVSYLGFPATMGADFMDYVLVDRFVTPDDEQAFFSEKFVFLPTCYQANDDARGEITNQTSRNDCGLPEEGLVLCCFNNSYKISPEVFDVWMRLLNDTKGSVLWLLAANDLAVPNLHKEAVARGVDAGRLIFAPRVSFDAHLERHRHADLFLDTLPCNAHTTASDALRGGVPVLTCRGNTFAGRVAGSLLNAIDMPELVTTSLDEYEHKARTMIRAPDHLKAMRRKIEQKRDVNSLFDPAKLTRAIERAYEQMWQRWLAGGEPQAFAIENE